MLFCVYNIEPMNVKSLTDNSQKDNAQKIMSWNGLPYYPISHFYKEHFGDKVQKIPVSIASDCPNRRGLKGMQTCVFCDVWGSAAYPEQQQLDLVTQVEKYKKMLANKYNASQFLAYFQAYTNTFMGVQKLRESFDTVLKYPEIKGIIIGTRPDCLSTSVFNLWNEFSKKCFLSVELGVQSFFDDQLIFLRRGHTKDASIEAIKKIKNETSVDLGIHLIFGIPNETDSQIIETAQIVSSLPINHVKLHNLHVLINTPLEKMYRAGQFDPISLEEYSRKVVLFLQYLSPNIKVQRLGAMSNRWNELIAPEWTRFKMNTYQYIIDDLNRRNAYQGQLYKPSLIDSH